MSDKLKVIQEHSNVLTVPPRVQTITYKGHFGKIEYHPLKKTWSYVLKLLYPVTHRGESATEAEAKLELKKLIDTASQGNNKHVRSTD